MQIGGCVLHNDDCLKVLPTISNDSIDLTVTSPPYDNIRSYNDNIDKWGQAVWEGVIEELYRVTKKGGVVVWVVGDATIKGNETGTSFKQALHFKGVGFNLHDTMIYSKGGRGAMGSNMSYWQDFEYMLVFSKGRLSTWNPIEDRKNKTRPRKGMEAQGHRFRDGRKKGNRVVERKEYGKRFNIWQYHESGTRIDHPAVFPQELANDHIVSWSNEGDVVLDPFMGSGTTGISAEIRGRSFVGIELDLDYFKISEKRIQEANNQFALFNNIDN